MNPPSEIVFKALLLATELHSGQVDMTGLPYILHPLEVFKTVRLAGGDDDQQCAALLHDTVEDCGITVDYLFQRGMTQSTCLIVHSLTRRRAGQTDEEPYDQFVDRICRRQRDVVVKLADVNHNLSRLHSVPDYAKKLRLQRKYQLARHRLMQVLSQRVQRMTATTQELS